jgi:hypothetical protein
MRLKVRKISARSAFLVALTLHGIVGLLVGVVLAVVSRLEVPAGTEPNLLSTLGMWSILVFPLTLGLVAGLTAAVAASLYNAAASVVGGLRIELHGLSMADLRKAEDKKAEELNVGD